MIIEKGKDLYLFGVVLQLTGKATFLSVKAYSSPYNTEIYEITKVRKEDKLKLVVMVMVIVHDNFCDRRICEIKPADSICNIMPQHILI